MMEKYIENLVKGAFEYDAGRLILSEKKIEVDCGCEEESGGTFTITSSASSDSRNVHLSLYTSDPRISISLNEYSGTAEGGINIAYNISSHGLGVGDVFKGDISVISDMGEYVIPVVVNVLRAHLISSVGQIKNLFHFTNLARADFSEAVRVFYTDGFETIFDNSDRNSLFRYRAFSEIKGSAANVEEFLISVNKKTPVVYSFTEENIKIRQPEQNVHGEIEVRRSGWGYTDIQAETDGDFIRLSKHEFSEYDFLGNSLKIVYDIDTAYLHAGMNYGSIRLRSAHSDISMPVFVDNTSIRKNVREHITEVQKLNCLLTSTYLKFRIHDISSEEWIASSSKIVERMLAIDNRNVQARLYQAQLLLSSKRYEEAGWILERAQKEYGSIDEKPVLKGYYLYLSAMHSDDEKEVEKAVRKVWDLYAANKNSDRLLWILLYLDENIRLSPEREKDMLEKQFEKGSFSPLIYLEAYGLFSKDPSMLTKLSDFEVQVLNFAVKYGLFNKDIESQTVLLAARIKYYSEVLFKIMAAYYEEFKDDDMLSSICSYLIRNGKSEHRFFRYFELAAEHEMKITNLYEYYVYALPEGRTDLLPKNVLMYFGFDNDLSWKMKAYVYANMIVNEKEIPQMLASYKENIGEFALDHFIRRDIDENLTIIYDYLKCWNLSADDNKSEILNAAFDLAFRYHVKCHDPGLKAVIVIEDQFNDELRVPLKDCEAYPDIYGNDYEIFFEDGRGNRYSRLDQGFEVVPLLHSAAIMQELEHYDGDNIGIEVFLSEAGRNYVTVTSENAGYVRKVTDSAAICPSFKKDLRRGLLQFYFDEDLTDELDDFLMNTDISVLSCDERNEFLKFMVRRDMGDRAYEIIREYGAYNIDPKVLVRLSSRLITINGSSPDEGLLWLTYLSFSLGKYDEIMLGYLSENYKGTTRNMRSIWKAGMNFDIDVYTLEERIIRQMLMTRSFVGEKDDIFFDYVRQGAALQVETAYLSFSAYEYFIKERIMDERIFEELTGVYRDGRPLNDVCMLALIQFYSDRERTEEINDIMAVFIHNMLKRNVLFEFFRKYRDIVPELSMYDDVSLIEYRTNPRNRVVLHYILNDGRENTVNYVREEMVNMYGGIFSRRFVLFFGETLQFYITEEYSGSENLTSSGVLEISDTGSGGRDSRYEMLNDMLLSRTLEDYDSFDEILKSYMQRKYITDRVFGLYHGDKA